MPAASRILPYLILLQVLSLFLPGAEMVKSLLAALLFVFILANPSIRTPLRLSAIPKWIWWTTAFFIWILISLSYSQNATDGWKFIVKRLPLLLFPLSLGLINVTSDTKNRLLRATAYIIAASCGFALICSAIQVFQTAETGYFYNDSLSIHIGQQSIYTSLFVNAAIFILGHHLHKLPRYTSSFWWHVLLLVFLFIISYLLASRNMMLILYGSIFILACLHIIKKKKYIQGFSLIGFLIAAFLLVYSFFPKTINRFKELGVTKYDYSSRATESHYDGEFSADQWNGANFRLAAWSCGWQLFKEQPLLGTGIGDKRTELYRVYAERNFQFAIDTKKNVHNNYLDILYSTGIIGLLLFLMGWIIMPLSHYIKHDDRTALLIHTCLIFAMITEVYFDRSLGPFSLAFWTCLLTSDAATNPKS